MPFVPRTCIQILILPLPEARGCFPNQDFQDLINHNWWLWNCLLAQLQWYLLPPYSYSTHYFSPYLPPSSFSTQTPCFFLCRYQWFLFLKTFTGTIHRWLLSCIQSKRVSQTLWRFWESYLYAAGGRSLWLAQASAHPSMLNSFNEHKRNNNGKKGISGYRTYKS